MSTISDQDPWRFFFAPEADDSGKLTAGGQRLHDALSSLPLEPEGTYAMLFRHRREGQSTGEHSNAFVLSDGKAFFQYHGGRVCFMIPFGVSVVVRTPGEELETRTCGCSERSFPVDGTLQIAKVSSSRVMAATKKSFKSDLFLSGLMQGKTKIEESPDIESACKSILSPDDVLHREEIFEVSTASGGEATQQGWAPLTTQLPTDRATLCGMVSDFVSLLAKTYLE